MVYNSLYCQNTAPSPSLDGSVRQDKNVIHHARKSVITPVGVYLSLDVSAAANLGEQVISYSTNQIGCEKLDDVLIASIGNESIGYVMFQRGITPETGADEPPYFEFDDQCNGGTEIIKSVTLTKNKLLIETTLPTEKDSFEITLDATSADIALLSSQLRAIFHKHEDKLHLNLG